MQHSQIYILLALIISTEFNKVHPMSDSNFEAVRFLPGTDLKKNLTDYATENHILSGFIVTCVGSLKNVTLRMAGAKEVRDFPGPLEIVSMVGTFSTSGSHFHISVSDEKGRVFGGHLMEGSVVHTTAETIIGKIPSVRFNRKHCQKSGWPELSVEPLKHQDAK